MELSQLDVIYCTMGLVVNRVRIQKCDFIYNKNAFQ